jgi:hypothetical protein
MTIETKEFDQVEGPCFVNEVGHQVAFLEWWDASMSSPGSSTTPNLIGPISNTPSGLKLFGNALIPSQDYSIATIHCMPPVALTILGARRSKSQEESKQEYVALTPLDSCSFGNSQPSLFFLK